VIMQYESTGNVIYDSKYGRTAIPASSPTEAKMVGFKFDPDGAFILSSGNFKITRMRWYTVDETAIRAGIKDQNEIMSTEEFYGPPMIKGVSHDFFHDVVTDIMQPMSVYHSHRSLSSNAQYTNSFPSARLGILKTPLPQFPTNDFLVGTGLPEYLSIHVFYNHYVAYFMRMFACVRGSMDVQIVDTSYFAPRKSVWALVTRTRGLLNNPPPAQPPPGFGTTQMPVSGNQYMNLSLIGEGKASLPWYSSERFGYARSTVPDQQHPFHYTLTVGCAKEAPITINYKTGKDFSLTHFISTPILTS